MTSGNQKSFWRTPRRGTQRLGHDRVQSLGFRGQKTRQSPTAPSTLPLLRCHGFTPGFSGVSTAHAILGICGVRDLNSAMRDAGDSQGSIRLSTPLTAVPTKRNGGHSGSFGFIKDQPWNGRRNAPQANQNHPKNGARKRKTLHEPSKNLGNLA